jgi:hypothetical protein
MSKSLKECIEDISTSDTIVKGIADTLQWSSIYGVDLCDNFRIVFSEEPGVSIYTYKQLLSNVKAALASALEPDNSGVLNRHWVENEVVKIASVNGISVRIMMIICPDESPVVTDSFDNSTPGSEWFLDEAKRIQIERGQQYDRSGGQTGERSMARTVAAFKAITDKDITESEGWLLLQLLKDVRQWSNPWEFHLDSAIDCVSYSALKAESLAAGK